MDHTLILLLNYNKFHISKYVCSVPYYHKGFGATFNKTYVLLFSFKSKLNIIFFLWTLNFDNKYGFTRNEGMRFQKGWLLKKSCGNENNLIIFTYNLIERKQLKYNLYSCGWTKITFYMIT